MIDLAKPMSALLATPMLVRVFPPVADDSLVTMPVDESSRLYFSRS